MRISCYFLIGFALSFLSLRSGHSALFNVADGDVGGLKSAIKTSNANGEDDTIELAPNGTYTLTTVDNGDNGLPAILSDSSTKLAIHGNGATIQRSTSSKRQLFRIFYIDYGADLSLSELTIANGALATDTDSFGGGIYNFQGSLVMDSCVLKDNQAAHGAGLYSRWGRTFIITNTVISGNIAGDSGGGIDSFAEDFTIVGCTFSNNSAGSGGAIRNMFSDAASISNCSFTANHAGQGGGVFNDVGGIMSITNSVFDGNVAGRGAAIANAVNATGFTSDANLAVTHCNFANNSASFGGAIYNYTQRLSSTDPGAFAIVGVSDSVFASNTATYGGAIYSVACCGIWRGFARLTVTASTFHGNWAQDGGGIYITPSAFSSATSVSNSTFADNATYEDENTNPDVDGGGAIYCKSLESSNVPLALSNCTLSGNSAPYHGGGIFLLGNNGSLAVTLDNSILKTGTSGENIYNSNGTFTSQGYNLSNDNGGGFLTSIDDQINTDPMLDPGGLQNNGGPTQTIGLVTGSPAINAGDPNAPGRDQRYYLRNGTPDKGALEYSGTLAPLTSASRKTHGATGIFDVDLGLTGYTGVECRSGGAGGNHQLVLTFSTPVTIGSASVTTGTGSVSNISMSGQEAAIDLTGVTNAQRIVLTLLNVSDGANTASVISPMRVLLGDTNGNGIVDASDVAQTKAQLGQAVTTSNFRNDVNANGTINASDASIVKSQIGTSAAVPLQRAEIARDTSGDLKPGR